MRPHHLRMFDCSVDRVLLDKQAEDDLDTSIAIEEAFKLRNDSPNCWLSMPSPLTLSMETNHQRELGECIGTCPSLESFFS